MAVAATRTQASLDSDCQMLNDSFEGLLQCAQVSEPLRNTSERLQLRIHAARIVEASQSLLRLAESLKRDALLGDFAGRVRACEASTAASNARREEALRTLHARAHALAAQLEGRERVTLTLVGDEPLLEDLEQPDDPQGIAQRLYDIAALQ